LAVVGVSDVSLRIAEADGAVGGDNLMQMQQNIKVIGIFDKRCGQWRKALSLLTGFMGVARAVGHEIGDKLRKCQFVVGLDTRSKK
jgi:hypothetical protein